MIFVGTRQLLIVPFILSQLAWLCAPISPPRLHQFKIGSGNKADTLLSGHP